MAQSGFQTQLLYGSLTPGAVPSASRLTTNTSGVEIAINAADGKLFYKDLLGNVRVLADVNVQGAQGSASIVGGSIDDAVIGGTTPASGNFTTLRATSFAIPSLVGVIKSNGNAGFSVAVPMTDYVPGSAVGAISGVASLDAAGKVPLSQLPEGSTGGTTYLGTWDASSNTPTLVSGVGSRGQFYRVSVAGSTSLDGNSVWAVGDQVIFSGSVWERVPDAGALVSSVNGQTGAVVITRAGLGAASAGANFDITSLSGLTTALSVAQGGTGRTTLTGIVKGNGNSPFTAAVAGTDYAVPPTGNASQLLANNGTGGFSNITVGTGLSLVSGVLSATSTGSGTGTVTSVQVSGGSTGLVFSGGPVTSAGTLTLSGILSVEFGGTGKTTLNGILKGAGTSAIVSAIAGTDYAVPPNGTASQLIANNGTGGFSNVTLGAGLLYLGGVLSAPGGGAGGSGTVTSVDVSGGTTGLTVSGGPITANGVLTIGGRLAVPSGGTGAASITGIVRGNGTSAFSAAVPSVDYAIPPTGTASQLLANNGTGGFSNITVGTGLSLVSGVLSSTGSSAGTVTSVNVAGGTTGLVFTGGPVTSNGVITLSGTLSVANGGTGTTTLSGMIKGNGNSAFSVAVAGTDYAAPPTGTASQLLANNGTGGFSNITLGTGLSLASGVLSSTVTASIPDNSLTDAKISPSAGIQSTKLNYKAVGSSSVNRTIAARLGDFLMVKDFGAVGDGSTNDSIAVAAASAAATAAGKALVFSDGVYSVPSLSTIAGRTLWVGLGNVTIQGTVQYTDNTFTAAADTLTPLQPSAPYFSASGINFQSTTSDYALRLKTAEQGAILSTFSITNCKFYGNKGLLAQNMIGFELVKCEFNNVVVGAQLEGCVDGTFSQCRWENQAEVGVRLTNTVDHGTAGFDKAGGKNIRFNLCEFLYCVVGIHADKSSWVSVSSSVLDYCATPVYLTGSTAKLIGSYFAASNAPSSRFSSVSGYVAPPITSTALYGRPGGYAGGDISVSVTAHCCEFTNYNAGSTNPVVQVNGYFNATYPEAAQHLAFYDCSISQTVNHAAGSLLSLSRASILRVVGNKFVSTNKSTTITDAWKAENCTSVYGVLNDFTLCTQSGNIIGSSYERRLNTTFIQATEPTVGVVPGDTWVQP